MGLLIKPYEISIWEDQYDTTNNCFSEQKIVIIGSDKLTSQNRVFNPVLTKNVNGTKTLSFSVYYQYRDNITGEITSNPICQYLVNERKVGLDYDGATYNFIIKTIKQDTNNYAFEVTAEDQYVNELSKNGFNITFDAELNNNVGTIQALAADTLADTDWQVASVGNGSDFIPDIQTEDLVYMELTEVPSGIKHIELSDTGVNEKDDTSIAANAGIYAFYSCCKEKKSRFQFIYIAGGKDEIIKNSERVIQNKNCQYYVDVNPDEFYTQTMFGIYLPSATNCKISTDYRGDRLVYSADIRYNSAAEAYGTLCYSNIKLAEPDIICFSKTEYTAPNLIQNYITNPNIFKSTSGWKPGFTEKNQAATNKGTIEVGSYRENANKSVMEDILDGNFNTSATYTPYLHYTWSNANTCLVNTGLYDNRYNIIKSDKVILVNGAQFVFDIKYRSSCDINVEIGCLTYDVNDSSYILDDSKKVFLTTILAASVNQFVQPVPPILSLNNYHLTKNELKNTAIYIRFTPINNTAATGYFDIESCELFPYIGKDTNKNVITPTTQPTEASTNTTYTYYNYNEVAVASSLDDITPLAQTFNEKSAKYTERLSCERRRSITAKESNRFNILQTLSETFKCWMILDVHYNNKNELVKQICFKNTIGKDNGAGFRYGVNLKSISRTDDSKQIVSKLIVKQNSNKFGQNGFCSITRAPSNQTGEAYIYNFDYYINQGLLDADSFNLFVNQLPDGSITDGDKTYSWGDFYTTSPDTQITNPELITTAKGYYPRLAALNKELQSISEFIIKQSAALTQAKGDVELYTSGYQAAQQTLEEKQETFFKVAGWDWKDKPNSEQINWLNNTEHDNKKYLTACIEAHTSLQEFKSKMDAAISQLEIYQNAYQAQTTKLTQLTDNKNKLNQCFYKVYYRFIQEGTWNSEEYYDDEKYYLDALSTAYTSSVPKVSYSLSVLELSQIPEYADFTFELGDKTYIEDSEFFGYDENGNPVQEDVVISESSYNLDSPDKNTLKIQNYKNEFQDLFKRITATVQSVQYSTGSYEKAAALAESTAKIRGQFLQEAFDNAGMTIRGSGEQAVRLDEQGLTITDKFEPNCALRAVSGGIALTEDGGNTWKLGLTANGVSASLITTGILNAGEVNIMNGNEPAFRWDSHGITAYDFVETNGIASNFTTNSGVRFDKFGIYGYRGVDGSTWAPNCVAAWTLCSDNGQSKLAIDENSIRKHSIFELTRESLYLNPGKGLYHYCVKNPNGNPNQGFLDILDSPIIHSSYAAFGKVDDIIYNAWTETDHQPYYDPSPNKKNAATFVRVFSVGPEEGNQQLNIYDDGTMTVNNIYFTGKIAWTSASSPYKKVYAKTALTAPKSPTDYTAFPKTDTAGQAPVWHQDPDSKNDQYYSETSNGGQTWSPALLMSGLKGDDAFNISITSNKGFSFTNSNISEIPDIMLTVHISRGDEYITDKIDNPASTEFYNYGLFWYIAGNETPLNTSSSKTIVLNSTNSTGVISDNKVKEGDMVYCQLEKKEETNG